MPRAKRKKSQSGIYHVILRGINKQTIFKEEEDYIRFLRTLKSCQEKSGYKVYAYCLMGNHIHLLLKEEKEELGNIMRRIGASFVFWYNNKYNRCGHLFQDRYKSEPVEDEVYFLTVVRYIHQNPIKAGIAKNVDVYKWSSYREYIGESDLIYTDFALNLFSNDRKKAIESFKSFHLESNEDKCLDINENKKITDTEAIEIIKKICHLHSPEEVQTLRKDVRNRYLKAFKQQGLSTRQIARLTGVSRHIVLKV